jgi:hypothetical protein
MKKIVLMTTILAFTLSSIEPMVVASYTPPTPQAQQENQENIIPKINSMLNSPNLWIGIALSVGGLTAFRYFLRTRKMKNKLFKYLKNA